eukprot:4135810-Prymnesium_polylepis.1
MRKHAKYATTPTYGTRLPHGSRAPVASYHVPHPHRSSRWDGHLALGHGQQPVEDKSKTLGSSRSPECWSSLAIHSRALPPSIAA